MAVREGSLEAGGQEHTVWEGGLQGGGEEEEAGPPSTPASFGAGAGARLGHGSLVRRGSGAQCGCLPGRVGIGGSRAGGHAPSEGGDLGLPLHAAQSLSAVEGADERALGVAGARPGAACAYPSTLYVCAARGPDGAEAERHGEQEGARGRRQVRQRDPGEAPGCQAAAGAPPALAARLLCAAGARGGAPAQTQPRGRGSHRGPGQGGFLDFPVPPLPHRYNQLVAASPLVAVRLRAMMRARNSKEQGWLLFFKKCFY